MTNHPNRQPTVFRPKFRRAHKDWGYVASGIDKGEHFVRGDYGYPVPEWSDGQMRVRRDYNDYQDCIWIIEAKVAKGKVIPDDCKMI